MSEPTFDDLLLTPYEQIDFKKLSSELLVQLAVQRYEPFIATCALGQLAVRDGDEARDAALAVLDQDWDHYLTASAITILFSRDPHAAMSWMTAHLPACTDAVILGAMVENVMSDVSRFENAQGRGLIALLADRVREHPADRFSDPEEVSSFLDMATSR
jgi:hypothetical protein